MTKSILVVDDDEDLREAVAMVLEGEGYDVHQASGGAEALTRLRSGAAFPHLIILDLMMPGMNGWQFREQQSSDPKLSSIPVIVLTASRSLHLNPIDAQEVVFKPLKVEQLIEAVARNC